MELYFLNKKLETVGIVDTPVSVQWHERYSEVGTFEIHIELDETIVKLLKDSYFIIRNGSDRVGVIEYYDSLDSSEEGEYITIMGRFAECLIGYRIIRYRKTFNADNSVDTSGTMIINDKKVSEIIKILLADNVLSPRLDDGSINTDREMKLFDKTVDDSQIDSTLDIKPTIQVSYEDDFLEVIYDLLNSINSSIKVNLITNSNKERKLKISLFTGKNRSYGQKAPINPYIVFSQYFDNLISANYTYDKTEERNAIYIGGEESTFYKEEGRAMTKYDLDSNGNTLTDLDRKEIFVDGSDISQQKTDDSGKYIKVLDDADYKKALENRAKDSVINASEKLVGVIDLSTYVYGVDYNLGDVISIDDYIFGVFNKRLIGMDFIDEETSTMEPVFEE